MSNTIPFYQAKIAKRERILNGAYTGYFSPECELVEYSTEVGNSHNDWRHPVSVIFIKYIGYMINGDSKIHLGYDINNDRDSFDTLDDLLNSLDQEIKKTEIVYHYYSQQVIELDKKYAKKTRFIYENAREILVSLKLKFELLKFFKVTYQNGNFFRSIGRIIRIENMGLIKNRLNMRYKNNSNFLKENEERLIKEEIIKSLISNFKTIVVDYLKYDSIETFKPDKTFVKVNELIDPNPMIKYDLDFINNPRFISSSHYDINERFFNYLIMNWEINQIPGYTLDPNSGIYTKQSDLLLFHETPREREFKEEIIKIKKLVPLKDRYKYIIK